MHVELHGCLGYLQPAAQIGFLMPMARNYNGCLKEITSCIKKSQLMIEFLFICFKNLQSVLCKNLNSLHLKYSLCHLLCTDVIK
jgi:hypothetical protein